MTPAGMSEPDLIENESDPVLLWAEIDRLRALTPPAVVPEPAYTQSLIDWLLMPPAATTGREEAEKRRQVAEHLHLLSRAAPAAVREPAPDYHESTNAAWKTALGHPAVPPSEEKK